MSASVRAMRRLGFAVVAAAYLADLSTVAADASLSLASGPGYPGTTTPLAVSLARATNVVAAQFDLGYDVAKVTPAVASTPTSTARQFVRSRQIAPGVVRVVAYTLGRTYPTNRAQLAVVPFTLSSTIRDSSGPIVPQNVVLGRPDGSAVTPVTLREGTVFARPVYRDSEGTTRFLLASQAGQTYRVEATTDFVTWVPISTNSAVASFLDIVDADSPFYRERFYRSAALPQVGPSAEVRVLPGEPLALGVTGAHGQSYAVEYSTDLAIWVRLAEIDGSGSEQVVPVPEMAQGGGAHFFQVRPLPAGNGAHR